MSNQRRNDFLIPLLAVISDAAAIEAAFLLSVLASFFFSSHIDVRGDTRHPASFHVCEQFAHLYPGMADGLSVAQAVRSPP